MKAVILFSLFLTCNGGSLKFKFDGPVDLPDSYGAPKFENADSYGPPLAAQPESFAQVPEALLTDTAQPIETKTAEISSNIQKLPLDPAPIDLPQVSGPSVLALGVSGIQNSAPANFAAGLVPPIAAVPLSPVQVLPPVVYPPVQTTVPVPVQTVPIPPVTIPQVPVAPIAVPPVGVPPVAVPPVAVPPVAVPPVAVPPVAVPPVAVPPVAVPPVVIPSAPIQAFPVQPLSIPSLKFNTQSSTDFSKFASYFNSLPSSALFSYNVLPISATPSAALNLTPYTFKTNSLPLPAAYSGKNLFSSQTATGHAGLLSHDLQTESSENLPLNTSVNSAKRIISPSSKADQTNTIESKTSTKK